MEYNESNLSAGEKVFGKLFNIILFDEDLTNQQKLNLFKKLEKNLSEGTIFSEYVGEEDAKLYRSIVQLHIKELKSTKDNRRCASYHEKTKQVPFSDYERGLAFGRDGTIIRAGTYKTITVGECYGTREREECHCGGDRKKCDFYKKGE